MLEERIEAARLAAWVAEVDSRRAVERWALCCPASLMVAGRRFRGEIWDLSPLGALVRLNEVVGLAVRDRVLLMPRGYQSIAADIRHIVPDQPMVGLKLEHDEDAQAKMAKWLDLMRSRARR